MNLLYIEKLYDVTKNDEIVGNTLLFKIIDEDNINFVIFMIAYDEIVFIKSEIAQEEELKKLLLSKYTIEQLKEL